MAIKETWSLIREQLRQKITEAEMFFYNGLLRKLQTWIFQWSFQLL